MRIYQAFIIAELKMFLRDRAALFWTLAFPTVMMVVFGLFNFGGFEPPEIGIVDRANNDASKSFGLRVEGRVRWRTSLQRP